MLLVHWSEIDIHRGPTQSIICDVHVCPCQSACVSECLSPNPMMSTNMQIFEDLNEMALEYYLFSCHFPSTNILGYSFVDF